MRKITCGIICVLCLLVMMVCAGCRKIDEKGAEEAVVEMPGEALRACCRIYTKSQCSSGFIVFKDSEKVVIAAALHGLSDWGEGSEVFFFDGSSAFGQVFGSDDELDAGFIEIAISDLSEGTADNLLVVTGPKNEEIPDNPELGSGPEESLVDITNQIYAYDLFPDGSSKADPKAQRYEGQLISEDEYIYDYDRNMLFGKLERVNDGMSGTPVFSDDGKCLGMIVAGNDDGQFAGIFYDEIMKLLYFP